MYNPKDPEQTAAVAKCVHDMMDRALEMDGTVSVGFVTNVLYDKQGN